MTWRWMIVIVLLAEALVGASARAGQVIPTQLRGLRQFSVSARVLCDDWSADRDVEQRLRALVKSDLEEVGLEVTDSAGATLRIEVECGLSEPHAGEGAGWMSAATVVMLAEPVCLKRDSTLEIADGGGGVTWMEVGIASASGRTELLKAVEDRVGWSVGDFLSDYAHANDLN